MENGLIVPYWDGVVSESFWRLSQQVEAGGKRGKPVMPQEVRGTERREKALAGEPFQPYRKPTPVDG